VAELAAMFLLFLPQWVVGLRSLPSQRVAIRQSCRAAAAKFIRATGATVNAVYTL
jgi:hypothetical protein